MAAPAYATLDDLAQWLDEDLPLTAPGVLRSASYAVADSIALAVYQADVSGYPTNTALREALRDATCAQAAWYITNEIDVNGGAATSAVEKSVKIGSAAVEYADSVNAANARFRGLNELCLEAERIIRRAGFSTYLSDLPFGYSAWEIVR